MSSAIIEPPSGALVGGTQWAEAFSPSQWETLLSIMDTIVSAINTSALTKSGNLQDSRPAISVADYEDALNQIYKPATNETKTELLDRYLAEKPSENATFQELLARTLLIYTRADARKKLGLVLSALRQVVPYPSSTRIQHEANGEAGTSLHPCRHSSSRRLPHPLRNAKHRRAHSNPCCLAHLAPPSLAPFTQTTHLRCKEHLAQDLSLLRPISGFPPTPLGILPGAESGFNFMDFSPTPQASDEIKLDAAEIETIDTDVVIVGSGCGGAVCAKVIAEAGYDVIVLDKAYHHPTASFPLSEAAAGQHMFEMGAIDSSDDGSITVVAGSSWGGGGTINWSASLQLQSYVRKEWAEQHSLPLFQTQEFQQSLDRVCDQMGVSAVDVRHNHGNQVLLEGARRLGFAAKTVPQNRGGTEHECGYCTLGCRSAGKASSATSWLPAAGRAGARFIEGFRVERVLFRQGKQKQAVGVKGTWNSRREEGKEIVAKEVVIRARKVIISCGTLWSPIVLLNSGIKNKHIGRNLHLHPVSLVAGVFKEDVRPWEGNILTSVCTSFENLDGAGHGTKLEGTCMMPSWVLTFFSWTSGLDFKLKSLAYRRTNAYISLARDRDSGRVYKDAVSGAPRIAYTPSAFDRKHILQGVLALAQILFVQGAEEVHVSMAGTEAFVRGKGSAEERFQKWLQVVEEKGNEPPTGVFASAHQMGTCRMSSSASAGVVDQKGRVWGTQGLYVADVSVFPSASGVNPMVTNMAIADWIARGLVEELRAEVGKGVHARL